MVDRTVTKEELLERAKKPAADAIAAFTQRMAQDNLEKKGLYLPGSGAVPALGSLAAPSIE